MPVVVGKNDEMLKRVTCDRCASILQYWPNEPSWTGFFCDDVKIMVITCPACGSSVRTDS